MRAPAVLAAPILAAALTVACGPALPPGPVVRVDGDGFFASRAPVDGAWLAGEGVTLLVPRDPGDPMFGRLTATAATVTVLAGEGFAPHSLRTESNGEPLSGVVRSALADALAAGLADGGGDLAPLVVAALRHPEPPGGEETSAAARWPLAATPVPEGAPLAARVPGDLPFVWLRSVEAGYRLASLFDDLAARVLAAGGDGRDAATLRLTLHDLLLPTIWRANPNGEKGVGECAVVVAPPLSRGRLRAALILRVVDPVLHDMETRAGIALESRPDHLWRPVDDPFPLRRVRRNERRRVADVEVIATDAGFADMLAFGVRSSHAGSSESMAFLSGPGADPEHRPGRRALAAVLPPGTDVAPDGGLRAALAEGAAALLARHWPDARTPVQPGRTTQLDLRRVEVRTDAEGAFVRLGTASEGAAARWVEALSPPADADAATAACAANVADLGALVLLDGVRPDPVERALIVLGFRPVCPAGGTYRVHPLTGAVACSAHGGPGAASAPGPPRPWPVTKVTRIGSDVSLRVAIDWRRKE